VLTSGLLLTEIPESELKVSWRFHTFLLEKPLFGDGGNDFSSAAIDATLGGGSSASVLLSDDEAFDLAREGGFDSLLTWVSSLWLSLEDDDARDDALEGAFELSSFSLSSLWLSLADDDALDDALEGSFAFPLFALSSSWLPPNNDDDEPLDDALEGGFELFFGTFSSSIVPTWLSTGSIESLRRPVDSFKRMRSSDGASSLLLRCFRRRLLRTPTDLS
jgi:hypothetical protein